MNLNHDKRIYFNELKRAFFTIYQTMVKLKRDYFQSEKYIEDFYYTLIRLRNISAVFHEKELCDISMFMLKQFDKKELQISIKKGREKKLIKCLFNLLKFFYKWEEESSGHTYSLSWNKDRESYLNEVKGTFFAIRQTMAELKWAYFRDVKHVEDFYCKLIKLQEISTTFYEKELCDISMFMLKQFNNKESKVFIKKGGEKTLIKCLITLLKLFNKQKAGTNLPNYNDFPQNSKKKLTFIIVDDDYPFAQVTYEELLGNEIRRFIYTEQTDLDAIAYINPDLIAINMLLPDKKGFELVKSIRMHQKLENLPILALTNRLDEQHHLDVLSNKVDNILCKPFTDVALLSYVANMVKYEGKENKRTTSLFIEHKNEMSLLLEKEWDRFIRFQSEFCLVYMCFESAVSEMNEERIQKFHKSINLLYIFLQDKLRKCDDIRMWGPNKMVILLPKMQLESGKLVARRLIKLIDDRIARETLQYHVKAGVMESERSLESEQKMLNMLTEKVETGTSAYGLAVFPLLNEKQEHFFADNNKTRALIVDDDRISTSLIMNHFSDEEWEFETCIDIKNAVEKAISFKPGFILCETKMNDLDGFLFCQQIRQIPQLTNVKFYFLTEQTLPQYVLRAYEVGADDYITKPFSLDVLEAKMKRARN
ncbi:response regulator [Priestia abyssalis]|uniref:response regulator n=1 Tax=Priestia abyssalis TaxID=1221450 RepID=UPI001F24266D|nr:response regulator [Priestia abyssalis]